MPRHILFDLDGTLIDSADAILAGFDVVLREAGIAPLATIDRSLIGPPLPATLARLTGLPPGPELARLAGRFTDWYDNGGFRGSSVYGGIPDLLEGLHAAGKQLHIVTNKRLRPTLLILDWLGWRAWFGRIDTHDLRPGELMSGKSAVLGRLLAEEGIAATDAVYVGDRVDDVHAAADHRLPCLVVAWGYGADDVMPAGTEVVATPAELAQRLAQA